MKTYNKLVRDYIPDIIKVQGKQCLVRALSEEEYKASLLTKLTEEAQEVLATQGEIGELADVLEVVYAIAELQGYSLEQIERTRLDKREARGGFCNRVFLIATDA